MRERLGAAMWCVEKMPSFQLQVCRLPSCLRMPHAVNSTYTYIQAHRNPDINPASCIFKSLQYFQRKQPTCLGCSLSCDHLAWHAILIKHSPPSRDLAMSLTCLRQSRTVPGPHLKGTHVHQKRSGRKSFVLPASIMAGFLGDSAVSKKTCATITTW